VSNVHKLFVGYPYSLPAEDYRKPFSELEESFPVKFVFADAEITNKQLLDKVALMIQSARFSLFDVSGWNPNVTLELGIAVGQQRPYYLLFNPANSPGGQPPADLGGLDRIQYGSYAELGKGLAKLLLQEFGLPAEGREMASRLAELQDRVPEVVRREPGLMVGEVADRLEVPTEMAKIVVRPLVGTDLRTPGKRKGTRYYPLEGEAR